MKNFFADFHVHVGLSESGRWVKIPTSARLTLRNILAEAAERKGLQIVGVVDALSPLVRDDFALLSAEGLLVLDSQGGYRYDDRLTLLLGAEIETSEPDGGSAHTLVFLPDIGLMADFSATMSRHIRNIHMSSQNAHMPLAELVRIAAPFGALIVVAHAFTPHKGLYGSCTARMANILGEREMAAIGAVELGLSADSSLADRIGELASFTFITNSDAHSLDKIAREYNLLTLGAATFQECAWAFARREGRAVAANFGLDPRLGKYHRTFCGHCDYFDPAGAPFTDACPRCGSSKIVRGVFDRIDDIADWPEPRHPDHRPPYRHQVPLSFIPGVGGKALDKLLAAFGSEMNVLHNVDAAALREVVGAKAAAAIIAARAGEAAITAGGGGIYGKLTKN
ncbi:endonuclease Q family protein [Anaeroselena agilis]|uniref:Endonuclease Q family protein n=1 Tax=Anaeroselena agilis TaxID=3063788 RepID=A0ABU3NWA7_9FIRM|nr:endonuclease Q family protein [Selenomonadales bacterium 4137-cl]